jgi:transcriptional regulator with XRE-family HTH domain
MPTEYERLLAELREWCAAQYGRQKIVADYLGVTRQMVSNWINGQRQPNANDVLRLEQFVKRRRAGAGRQPSKKSSRKTQ